MENVMDWSAITYPAVTLNELSGEMIKMILEDVRQPLQSRPAYQQGGGSVADDLCMRAGPDGQPHGRHAARRQADRGREDPRWRVGAVAEGAKGEPRKPYLPVPA